MHSALSNIESYRPAATEDQIPPHRQQVAAQAVKQLGEAATQLARICSALDQRSHSAITQWQSEIAEVQRGSLALRKEAEDLLAEAKIAAEIARHAADLANVTGQGKAFGEASRKHGVGAIAWSLVAAISAIALFVVLYVVFEVGIGPPRPWDSWMVAGNVGHFAPRAFGLSLLSFLLVISIRNYRAERHNQIVNAQRASSLSTFEQFAKAAGQNETLYAAVLIQATRAIFAPAATAFGEPPGPEVTSVPTELLEMAKASKKPPSGS